MWKWDQSAGELTRDGIYIGKGYSGNGRGLNSPSMQAVRAVGPLPAGRWVFGGIAADNHTGPLSILISPKAGTETFGRSGFRCHGDNAKMDHTASHGCLILPRTIRQRIVDSKDRDLEVVT